MPDVNAGMPIFARLAANLTKTDVGNPGMSTTAAQAFIAAVVADINLSPLLQSEIYDLNSKSWTIDTSPTTGAGETNANSHSILIYAYSGSTFDNVINTGSLTGITLDNVSDFVGVLAHEAGHAEDPQLAIISYTGNGLAPGAETALSLFSEGKAQYNNIKTAQELYASSAKAIIAVRGDATGIAKQIADAGTSPSQTIMDGAASYLRLKTSTSGENYLSYYWNAALSRYSSGGSTVVPAVLGDLTSMNMDSANGLAFAQNANGTDTISVSFNTGTISSYIDTFGGYGPLGLSGTLGGQGTLQPVTPSPTGVVTDQIFNFSGGISTEDAYNIVPGIAEAIINYASANATGLATLIDLPNVGLASKATIGASNILSVQEANGTSVALQLDPSSDYTGYTYNITADANGGANLTLSSDRKADISFVIDTTSSMTPYIDAVKSDAVGLVNSAFSNGTDAQISLVGFKDPDAGYPDSVVLPFTTQADFSARQQAAVTAINGLTVDGGGDVAEGDYSGLLLALDGSAGAWRAASNVRRIALFTDAPVKDTNLAAVVNQYAHDLNTVVDGHKVVSALGTTVDTFSLAPAAAGTVPLSVEIDTIQVGTDSSASASVHQIASDNSGTFLTAPTPADLVNALSGIITKPPTSPALTVLDTSTNTPVAAVGTPYSGPVGGLIQEYINPSTDNLNITATTPNWFLHSGSGMDGIAVSSGNNILDGGTNSNFLTGGSGHDTFYLDDRAPDKPIFSTVANFHSGDSVTVWGVNATDFQMLKLDNQGAAGFTGLDLLFHAAGHIDTSFVLAGYSSADLGNGKLITSFGKTADLPNLPGSQYMTVTAV
jgi:hypothetical protein